MKVKKIDHINIVVQDMQESIDFYTSFFGFCVTLEKVLEGEWFETLMGIKNVKAICVFLELPESGHRIELLNFITYPGEIWDKGNQVNSIGIRHLALEVDNIEKVAELIKEKSNYTITDIISVPLHIVSNNKKLVTTQALHDKVNSNII